MPNPYHDENGRFCSKGEMRAAVDRLAREGKIDESWALRDELEQVEKDADRAQQLRIWQSQYLSDMPTQDVTSEVKVLTRGKTGGGIPVEDFKKLMFITQRSTTAYGQALGERSALDAHQRAEFAAHRTEAPVLIKEMRTNNNADWEKHREGIARTLERTPPTREGIAQKDALVFVAARRFKSGASLDSLIPHIPYDARERHGMKAVADHPALNLVQMRQVRAGMDKYADTVKKRVTQEQREKRTETLTTASFLDRIRGRLADASDSAKSFRVTEF